MEPLKLPSGKHLKRFVFWLIGRLCLAFVLFLVRLLRLAIAWIAAAFLSLERLVEKVIQHYDFLLSRTRQNIDSIPSSEVVTDIASYIEGRQVMLIAEMGAGKSTLVKYLCYSFGGLVKVYECEGLPGNWGGFEVVGVGNDFDAIGRAMQKDIDQLDKRILQRNQHGDNYLVGQEQVFIVEEFPEIVRRVPSSLDWIDVHSRRGKKARNSILLISQYDKNSAWGFDGKSELADSFIKIRLGKKALAHARRLGNNDLFEWLNQDSSHCLIDDYPCKIPAFKEMQAITGIISHQLSSVSSDKNNNYWELS